MAWKASGWNENLRDSTSSMGELGELEKQLGESVEDCLGLSESVLGIGKSGRGTLAFSG